SSATGRGRARSSCRATPRASASSTPSTSSRRRWFASASDVGYRRNLFAVTAASFIGFMGFTLVMPFLPLYFHQLGVDDVGRVAMWSGLSLGVTPALTAILAPAWGRLADRFGRKIMVERSLASFVLVMS